VTNADGLEEVPIPELSAVVNEDSESKTNIPKEDITMYNFHVLSLYFRSFQVEEKKKEEKKSKKKGITKEDREDALDFHKGKTFFLYNTK
jgi:hypothetical protein